MGVTQFVLEEAWRIGDKNRNQKRIGKRPSLCAVKAYASSVVNELDLSSGIAIVRRNRVYQQSCRPNGLNEMAKSSTILVKLVSTADTGYYYVTKKNPRTQTEKLSFRKFDPVARKHVEFKEGKIK